MKKKAMVPREIGWWLIALAVLVLVIIGLSILNKRGINVIDKLKDILRFGR